MRALEGDRGAVTVEAALALCSVVAVVALAVAAVAAAAAHLRCLDAAREAARLVARGEPDRAREAVARIGPSDAELEVRVIGDEVDVRVTGPAVAGLPGLRLEAAAYAVLEPAAVLAGPGRVASGPGDPVAGPAGDPSVPARGESGAPDGSTAPTGTVSAPRDGALTPGAADGAGERHR